MDHICSSKPILDSPLALKIARSVSEPTHFFLPSFPVWCMAVRGLVRYKFGYGMRNLRDREDSHQNWEI